MLIDVVYNTDETKKYNCLTTTLYTSGVVESNDVDTIVDVMQNYLHHYSVIIVRHSMNNIFDATIDDVLSVVKQAVKKAKRDWFKGVYCYKCEVYKDDIIIYIGCTDRYSYLESKSWECKWFREAIDNVNESEFCDVR